MKTHRPRTPVEMAIDRATGFEGADTVPVYVTLRCPSCKRRQRVPADQTDPEGTAEVVVDCPDCHNSGHFEEVAYFDKAGKQLYPE